MEDKPKEPLEPDRVVTKAGEGQHKIDKVVNDWTTTSRMKYLVKYKGYLGASGQFSGADIDLALQDNLVLLTGCECLLQLVHQLAPEINTAADIVPSHSWQSHCDVDWQVGISAINQEEWALLH